jgi:hypothetical protein
MRYAAKLLFQYRIETRARPSKNRTVEERIVALSAQNARKALTKADKRGRSSELHYLNNEGNRVSIEFVGVVDLMELGPECEKDTAWYEIKTMVQPMERKRELIPTPENLSAIKLENATRRHLPDLARAPQEKPRARGSRKKTHR